MVDLVIKNGTVVTATDIFRADVGISGEKIVSIDSDLSGEEVIDATDRLVFPGFVDPHVHLAMPLDDLVTTDDFLTGSIAAACGGTTTIIDFIETPPKGSLLSAAQSRRDEADAGVVIDYSLHLTASSASQNALEEIRALAGQGYTSLKLYTTYPGLMLRDDDILEILHLAKAWGLLPLVHAENDAIIERLKRELVAAGHLAPPFHPVSRPCVAEYEAIQRVIALARVIDTPVYFVHVSCLESLEAIERGRAAGMSIFAEVTPQHLLLDDSLYAGPGFEGAKYCCAPPLRSPGHAAGLWRGLADGRLQVVATDHCPWNYGREKRRGRHDFTHIPNGVPGVETRVPLLYERGVIAGLLGQNALNRFVDVCATTPAKLFGLYPQKGSIIVGGDADLVIYHPRRQVALHQAGLHQKVDYCLYEGWTVRGYPEQVLSRGKMIVRDGEFVGEAGAGRFVRRRSFSL